MEKREKQLVSTEELEKLAKRVQKIEELLGQFVKREDIVRILDEEFHKEARARGY